MKVRRTIEVISLWVFILSAFTWLLTGIELLFIPAKELMVVIYITKDIMLMSMIAFMAAGWWKTIGRFFKRIYYNCTIE